MAQKISQGNIFGRIGTGIGQGLAEQIPKEIERGRLASGLKELGTKKDLTPFQRYAELISIPGITPQAIESGSRLLEKEALQNSYRNISGNYQKDVPGTDLSNVDLGEKNAPVETLSRRQKSNQGLISSISQKPEINPQNPLSEKFTPRKPWSPERKNSRRLDLLQSGFTIDQTEPILADEEARYLALPAAEQAIYDRDEAIKEGVENKFEKQLADKLQKGVGEAGSRPLYGDITGDQLQSFKKNIEEDLRSNPNLSVDKAIDKWTSKALELAKTKVDVKNLGSKGNFDKFTKASQIRRSLENYGEIFRESGNEEEYFNLLQQLDKEGNGFGLSPQSAAYFSYPRSDKVNSDLETFPDIERISLVAGPSESIKLAKKLLKSMNSSDNPLAIAKYMKDKNPYFDTQSFFDELSSSENLKKLNDMQRRMVSKGVEDWTPNWGDISVLPVNKGRLK